MVKQARQQVKEAQTKGQKKDEKKNGKGRPQKYDGRCTACINRYLKIKGGVSQHVDLEACRQTQYEFTNGPVGAKTKYSKKYGSLATRVPVSLCRAGCSLSKNEKNN